MQDGHEEINVDRVMGTLRRRAPWVLLCVLLAAGAAFALSKLETKHYTATASLVFGDNQINQQIAGLQSSDANNLQSQQATNLQLVRLGDMAAQTASQLDHGLTKKKVQDSLNISGVGNTNIVKVAATSTSPELAAAVANTYAKQFINRQQSSSHQYASSALALVQKQLAALSPEQRSGPSGQALQDRAVSLSILVKAQAGDVKIAQKALVPTGPSSPKILRNTILGGVLGLLVGLGIAFLLERLDRRIRDPKDLESIYRLPLLGVVPESNALLGLRDASGQREAEAFRMIRAHLRYFNVDRDLETLLVVSPSDGDGKTTVARHLAGATAVMGARALLIETDLRRPAVARQLEIETGPGLSDVLIGASSLEEAVQSIEVGAPPADGQPRRHLDVLVAGRMRPPNPGELIESRAMESLLEQARAAYDLILIDTPPLSSVSDPFPLLSRVDGVIVVGRIGGDGREFAERLSETLREAEAPLLGVVANGFKTRRLDPYAYG